MSYCLHISPWIFLSTRPYHPSLSEGLPGYIPYRYGDTVDRFLVVVQNLFVYVKGSTGVHRLWVRHWVSSNVRQYQSNYPSSLCLVWVPFSLSTTGSYTKVKEHVKELSVPNNSLLPRFMPFPKLLALCKIETSFRI